MLGRTGTETSSSEAVSMFFLCRVSHCNRTCDPSLFQFGLAGNSCVEVAGLVLHEIAVVRYQGRHSRTLPCKQCRHPAQSIRPGL